MTGISSPAETSRRRGCTLDASIDALSKAVLVDRPEGFWLAGQIDRYPAGHRRSDGYIIRHGFDGGKDKGKISMDMGFVDDDLECIITDTAPASDPENWLARGKQRRPDEGGHGLNIINEIAASYDVDPGGE